MKITNTWLCKINNNKVNPVFCDFSVEEGKIGKIIEKDFNKYVDHKNESNENDCYNARGAVTTIPNVNFHEHMYSRLAKGVPINGPMNNFLNILKSLWWKLDLALDKGMVEASTHIAAYESIKNGVQYIFDHHSSPNYTKGSLQCIKEILESYNLKGVLCFEISDRNGNQLKEEALFENESFIKEQTNEKFKGLYGLHASFTVDDSTLSSVAKLIGDSDKGIHIHLCEDDIDNIMSVKKYGERPSERLMNNNLLNNKSILAHAIHLSEEDYEILKNSECAIAFNIESNLNNAVGLPNIAEFPDEVRLLIGTDGMHADIAKSLKQLFLILRYQGLSFEEVFRIIEKVYVDQISFVKQYFSNFTSLNVGKKADFIIWDYVPPTPLNSNNFFGHYIYGIIERGVKTSFCNNKFLMRDHNIIIPDTDDIEELINKSGNKLYNLMKDK